jgi:hypothetical protein
MKLHQHDPVVVKAYREKAAELAELRKELGERIGDLSESAAAQELEKLVLSTKQFDTLKRTLGPSGLFVAQYGVEVINNHTVSFVIPKGRTRQEIITEAQEVLGDSACLFSPKLRESLAHNEAFTKRATTSEKLCIDGLVDSSNGLTEEEQRGLLEFKELLPVPIEDLAVAFVTFFVATGGSLFGRMEGFEPASFTARTADNCGLAYREEGLQLMWISFAQDHRVFMAGRLPS